MSEQCEEAETTTAREVSWENDEIIESLKLEPPENLRCTRTNGKSRRFNGFRIEGKSLCKKHYLKPRIERLRQGKHFQTTHTTSHDLSVTIGVSVVKEAGKAADEMIESDEDEDEKDEVLDDNERVLSKKNEVVSLNVMKSKGLRKKVAQKEGEVGVSSNLRSILKKREVFEHEDGDFELRRSKRPKKNVINHKKNKAQNFSTSESRDNKGRSSRTTSKKIDQRRKHFSADDPNDDCQMCHQCVKSDRKVVRCRRGCRKRYCGPCIQRWYPQLSEEAVGDECPVCRGNCNFKDCLRKNIVPKDPKYLGEPWDTDEKINHLKYIVNALYPFLENLVRDQTIEKEMEAKIKGLSPAEVVIPKAVFSSDERVYCNNCSTSIVDLHRSCPICSYDLCLTCCREIREGCLRGGEEDSCSVS